MQHIRDIKTSETKGELKPDGTPAAEEISPPMMRDRALPAWVTSLSFIFTLGSEACIVALILLTAFFHSMVATQGQTLMSPLLTLLGLAPLLGLVVFDLCFAKALAGFRDLRERSAATMRAILGILVALSLAALHPLMFAPFAVGALLCWVTVYAGEKFLSREPVWDFLPQEAASVLSGRDQVGLKLAHHHNREHALVISGLRAASWLALICAFACAGWLIAKGIFDISGLFALGFLNFWSVQNFGKFLLQNSNLDPYKMTRALSVTDLPAPEDIATNLTGLQIRHLSATKTEGQALLSNISVDFEPGKVIAVTGNNFSGKSLLMRAIAGPHDLTNLNIQGCIRVDGQNPWQIARRDRNILATYVPPCPDLLPGSGFQNLSCFSAETEQERLEKILTRFVYTSDISHQIVNAADAQLLSHSERKALGLARAFFLRPKLYLLDRPEDGATEGLLAALITRIKQEQRFGAIFMIATENRALLDLCDDMIVMQGGRVVDFGPTEEIRQHYSVGWSRFIADRDQDSEDALDSWIRSQFRREGDDNNRRKVCIVANELLAFSCKDVAPSATPEKLRFEIKLFEGHCILRMLDEGQPLSSGTLEKARKEVEASADLKTLSPLAMVTRDSITIHAGRDAGMRLIEAKIEIYDPRARSAEKSHTRAKV